MRTWNAVLIAVVMAARVFATDDTPISVSLERTPCFGTCPSYVVTLHANGTVEFEGREYVAKKGKAEKKIDPSALAVVYRKIDEIGFWTLKDHYRTKVNPDGSIVMITDLPTQYVTVTTKAKTKRIEDYFGAPEGMRELEALIDHVAGVSQWVGNRAADARRR